MTLYVYRLKSGAFTEKTWTLAGSREEIDRAVGTMNADNADAEPWTAEIHECELSDNQRRKLAGQLMGGISTASKRLSSRTNGKLGGRPKKQIPNDR